MTDLKKVSVALRKVDKPLDPPWRSDFPVVFGWTTFVVLAATGFQVIAPLLGFLCAVASISGMVVAFFPRLFLPHSARAFLRETRVERRQLERRTNAHNRAWCLVEGSGKINSECARELYGTSYKKIDADVHAYAERYRAAVAADLLRVEGRNGRKLLRETVAERTRDLRELEERLDELGTDASPEVRAHARTLRESLERDRLALREPLALPSAKVVTH